MAKDRRYAKAQMENRMVYPAVTSPAALKRSSNMPVRMGNRKPPADPVMPPSPMIVATSFFGNMSETVV